MEKITNDRIRQNSPEKLNQEIDEQTETVIGNLAGADKAHISKKIEELEKEWDIERVLEVTASSLAVGGLLLGAFVNRKWFFLPGVVSAFLLQHSLQGWCPPLPLFRSMKFRTRKEIDREKFALKALRGDFDGVTVTEESTIIVGTSL